MCNVHVDNSKIFFGIKKTGFTNYMSEFKNLIYKNCIVLKQTAILNQVS